MMYTQSYRILHVVHFEIGLWVFHFSLDNLERGVIKDGYSHYYLVLIYNPDMNTFLIRSYKLKHE